MTFSSTIHVQRPRVSSDPVAVIGGGPAGCAAAHALTRQGFDAVLLEAGERGRSKACGDAFDAEALARLQALGLGPEQWLACGGRPVSTMRLRSTRDGGPEARIDAAGTWHIPRAALDQRLRDVIAGDVELRYQHRVTELRRVQDRWELTLRRDGEARAELVASAVVLAHGAGCRLSREWRIDGDPDVAAAVRTYIDAPGLDEEIVEVSVEARPGYAWAFPLPGARANVGFGVFAGARANVRAHAEALLARHGWRAETPWQGSGLAVWSGRGERWHDPHGLVSCGDAAGLVEPLTGGGITHALNSGAASGLAIARYLSSGRDATALELHSAVTRAFYERRFAPHQGDTPWTEFLRQVDRFAAAR